MITLPLIIWILGLAVFLFVDPAIRGGRLNEAGKWAYIIGLAVWVWYVAGKALL